MNTTYELFNEIKEITYNQYEWEIWFAWHPVIIESTNKYAWLMYVIRRKNEDYGRYDKRKYIYEMIL